MEVERAVESLKEMFPEFTTSDSVWTVTNYMEIEDGGGRGLLYRHNDTGRPMMIIDTVAEDGEAIYRILSNAPDDKQNIHFMTEIAKPYAQKAVPNHLEKVIAMYGVLGAIDPSVVGFYKRAFLHHSGMNEACLKEPAPPRARATASMAALAIEEESWRRRREGVDRVQPKRKAKDKHLLYRNM